MKIAIITGEESGDQLGADLVRALRHERKDTLHLIGVGGRHLTSEGLKSFFDAQDIALMGIVDVLKKLPRLIWLFHKLVIFIARQNPDCLVSIDSPDFTLRIARRIRKIAPKIPVIHYVAPSVWAWRPNRAKIMSNFVDHVLTILPFEGDFLKKLQGPPSTYVGHRIVSCPALEKVRYQRQSLSLLTKAPVLAVFPGSRSSEIKRMMPVFGETVFELRNYYSDLKIILPTLPEKETEVRKLAMHWKTHPKIVVGDLEKWNSLASANAALAVSGTVSLELALSGIPTVLAYKMDLFTKLFILPKIKIWSAALPNILADEPLVPEYFNEFAQPAVLARHLKLYLTEGKACSAQIAGFDKVMKIMNIDTPSGVIAAKTILSFLEKT